MGRLVEVQDPRTCPSPLTVRSGDVLLFRATGGRVKSQTASIELLGPFVPAVVGDNGGIFTPMGFPNTVLIVVRAPGVAVVELMTGDPLTSAEKTQILIRAEP